ncbi:MAG: ABC transporter permease [Clostridiales Family XIII bacterium]|nr:ABC transporter permease [Clostridiales Family XIII bacterium]
MVKYIVKRLLMLIPVLLGISLFILLLISFTPGDPARMMLGSNASEEMVQELREDLGLNEPVLVRYGQFLRDVVHGDFGTSYMTKRPVLDEMLQRFPYTLTLVVISLLLSLLIGIPLGIFAATHQYTWKDNATIFASLFCVSMPSFWFALLLIRYFGVYLKILPASGITTWQGWILPCVSMALGYTAVIARQTRSNLLEVIRQDYITTARAKGLSSGTILYRHAFKNATIPVIMIAGAIFGLSLGGAVVTEVIFSIPGLGQYTLTGLNNRDYPVIQSSVLILSMLFAFVILVIDVLFALIDPRIRAQYGGKGRRKKGGGADAKAQKIQTA